jgi:hypothetical protein
MGTRLRVVLPSVMAVVSVPLVAWDTHNDRVIESMGMAWDMGAPVWPYQASDILLRLLNAPAYAIAMPIANLLRLVAPMHFVLIVPAILIWWWFLGLTLDRGIVRWQLLGMLGVLLTLLLWTTTAIRSLFLMGFGTVSPDVLTVLTFLRFLTPAAWLLALSCLLICRRRARGVRRLA